MARKESHPFQQHVLAKHLEVFVPKPKTRELETNLIDWLDHLLQEAKIPLGTYEHSQSESALYSSFPASYKSEIAEKFAGKKYWENIIYGYSTYETDGHFVGIDSKRQIRGAENDFREQTLVIKFLLTNYATSVYRGIVQIPTIIPELKYAIVPAYASPSVELQDSYYSELYFTNLHYSDLSAHIITGIAETVLWKETEVWSHAWYSVLDRRCMKNDGRRVPIVLNGSDKKKRFGERQDQVICVMDYARVTNGGRR